MDKLVKHKLSRQRFFEVKQVMEDYNRDMINITEFRKLIQPEEAAAFESMFKEAKFDISRIQFN